MTFLSQTQTPYPQPMPLAFGFSLDRTSGSHHIFRHGAGLMLNLQPDSNEQAKRYQIRQLLDLVEEHGLSLDE